MATHSSLLAWRIPMDRGAWQATVYRDTKSQTGIKQLNMHTQTSILIISNLAISKILFTMYNCY